MAVLDSSVDSLDSIIPDTEEADRLTQAVRKLLESQRTQAAQDTKHVCIQGNPNCWCKFDQP